MCLYPPRDCALLPPRRSCLSLSCTHAPVSRLSPSPRRSPRYRSVTLSPSSRYSFVSVRLSLSFSLLRHPYLSHSIGPISPSLSHARRVFLGVLSPRSRAASICVSSSGAFVFLSFSFSRARPARTYRPRNSVESRGDVPSTPCALCVGGEA